MIEFVNIRNRMRTMDTIAKRLQGKLEEKGLSAFQLEKKVGLKRSAVYNILYGKSKNPGIDVMIAVADGLDCSLNDLVREEFDNKRVKEEIKSNPSYLYLEKTPENPLLYAQALLCTSKLLEKKQIAISRQTTMECIEEIYNYAIKSKKGEIDEFFAEWLFEKIENKEK